jgi:hypothetical protein
LFWSQGRGHVTLGDPKPKVYNMGVLAIPQVATPIRGWMGDLDWSLSWQVRPDRLYMAMTGFFDESGTHGAESPVVIVGGFLATVEQWDAYERDLKALLDEYGVKKFHAKELRQTKGNFKGWPRAKKAKFNSRFLQMADQHLACGISTVLPSDAYNRIYRAGALIRNARQESQYGLCVRAALWKALLFMQDRKANWPLNFVFEDGNGHEAEAAQIFYEEKQGLLGKYQGIFGSLTFETKTALPLAVADSLSYAVFRKSAGYSQHPTISDAAPVGESDPPYYVHKIPLSRTIIDDETLVALRDGLLAA